MRTSNCAPRRVHAKTLKIDFAVGFCWHKWYFNGVSNKVCRYIHFHKNRTIMKFLFFYKSRVDFFSTLLFSIFKSYYNIQKRQKLAKAIWFITHGIRFLVVFSSHDFIKRVKKSIKAKFSSYIFKWKHYILCQAFNCTTLGINCKMIRFKN